MITESKIKTGTLTFTVGAGPAVDFACQATNVRVSPSYDDDGDPVETLCGDKINAGKKESFVLAGTSIQDFTDPEGFLAFCWDNRMTDVAFVWTASATAPVRAGVVTILALEEGGDVNARLSTDWEFDIVGTPTRTYAP